MEYKTTIGLEIHIELATESKMFCSCGNDPDEREPNTNICPICLGYPGTLPVINKEAVQDVVKTALALRCEIAKDSFFERKNYFYPDLPKGYQISQYQAPLSRGGYLDIRVSSDSNDKKSKIQNSDVKMKRIRIERIHLEEDTGRLSHPEDKKYSLVDFNRAGVPLMELVTEPDIESAQEAREFVKELQMILRYLKVSNADMEKGQMRCEVNISLMSTNPITNNTNKDEKICEIGGCIRENSRLLGTKVEIKNLNSMRSMEKAIEFEEKRQAELLDKVESIVQETRGWHDTKEITFSQRSKEEAHDYRYFPEPDLPPLKIDSNFLDMLKAEIPELPNQRRERFIREYNLSNKEVELYVNQRDLGDYFEKVVSELREWMSSEYQAVVKEQEVKDLIKLASNYIATDLQAKLKESGSDFNEEKFLITPENFAEFLKMIYSGEMSSKIAKMVLSEMFKRGGDPSQIIEDKGWQQLTNESDIEQAVKDIIARNPKAVEDFKKGRQASLQFLVGQVMAETKGKAKPETVREILEKILA